MFSGLGFSRWLPSRVPIISVAPLWPCSTYIGFSCLGVGVCEILCLTLRSGESMAYLPKYSLVICAHFVTIGRASPYLDANAVCFVPPCGIPVMLLLMLLSFLSRFVVRETSPCLVILRSVRVRCCLRVGHNQSQLTMPRFNVTPPLTLKNNLPFPSCGRQHVGILEAQPSEEPPVPFSYLNADSGVSMKDNLIACAKTYTNEETHR